MTPRIITKKEYSLLVPAQQRFYDDLIQKGQVQIEIETPEAPASKDKSTPDQPTPERVRNPLDAMRGHWIKVLLINGDTLTGMLESVWKFEIILRNNEITTIILKHAILTVEKVAE
jgi:sRNA-binding regulator protein Hfq